MMRIRIIEWANRLPDEVVNFMMKVANSWKTILWLYVFMILAGAAVFSIVEDGYTLWDGVWWACITALSIGYGDIYPVTVVGRITGLVLGHAILLSIIPMIIAQITLRLIRDNDKFTHTEQEEIKAKLNTVLRQQALIMAHLGTVDPEAPRADAMTE